MNTNKSIIIGALASMFVMGSCSDDFLEVNNPTGEPLEEYYVNDGTLDEALTAAYAPLHWPDWDGTAYNDLTVDAEILGDDFWVGGSSITDNQHWHKLFNFEGSGTQTLATLWTDFYSGIKRCNDAIKYASWDGPSESAKKSASVQARLLRVYYYNILWHYYGNVPFYLENLTLPYTAPQMKADEIYAQLIVELEDIIKTNQLPMRWDTANNGRVSQAFAYMLYAEMVMYQNDKARYPQALSFMKEIISSGKYSLMSDYAEIWKESGEWGSESIFEITYDDNNAQRDWSTSMSAGGSVLPTLISPNAWPGGDGWNAGEDGWGFLPVRLETYEMFEEGDVRREGSINKFEDGTYGARFQNTGLFQKKYAARTALRSAIGTVDLNYPNNLILFRYAETLLNYAELVGVRGAAAAEGVDAQACLDAVRSRAGLGSIPVNEANIKSERRKEFVGEGMRFWDLIRWGDAATVLTENNEAFQSVRTFNPDKDKYLPIPQSEMSRTAGTGEFELKQNKGY